MDKEDGEYVPNARKEYSWNRQLVQDKMMECLSYIIVRTPKNVGDEEDQQTWAMNKVNEEQLHFEM